MKPDRFPLLRNVLQTALLAALLAGVKGAAEENESQPPEIFPDEISAGLLRPGEPVRILGKYQGLIDTELQLFDLPFRFILEDASLSSKLLDLRAGVDNLMVTGALRPADSSSEDSPKKQAIIDVAAVERGPGDFELYSGRLKELLDRPDRDPVRLIRFAGTAHATHRRLPEPKLMRLVEEAVMEAYRITDAKLDSGNAEGRFRLVLDIFKAVPDEDLLGKFLRELVQRYPDYPGIKQRLAQIGFRFVGGEWLSYGEFKTREGFVRHRGRWIRGVEREFFQVTDTLQRESLANLILRARTERAYAQLAQAGELARGMTRQEISEALGFPERVRRNQAGNLEIDQWDYGDRRVYLLNGQMILSWEDKNSNGGIQEAVRSLIRGEAQKSR